MIGLGYGQQNQSLGGGFPQMGFPQMGQMGQSMMSQMAMQMMMQMMMQVLSQLSAMSSQGGFSAGQSPAFGAGVGGGSSATPQSPHTNFLGGSGSGNAGGNSGGSASVAPSSVPSVSSGHSGRQAQARGTGYYPDNSAMEGGYVDRKGKPLHTLQDFLEGKAPYVSVAMDNKAGIPYGQSLKIPELEKKYGRPIPFRVVDTGGAFKGKGTSRIDICTRNRQASLDPTVNGPLTLQFQ